MIAEVDDRVRTIFKRHEIAVFLEFTRVSFFFGIYTERILYKIHAVSKLFERSMTSTNSKDIHSHVRKLNFALSLRMVFSISFS